jgi:hypothetical protein
LLVCRCANFASLYVVLIAVLAPLGALSQSPGRDPFFTFASVMFAVALELENAPSYGLGQFYNQSLAIVLALTAAAAAMALAPSPSPDILARRASQAAWADLGALAAGRKRFRLGDWRRRGLERFAALASPAEHEELARVCLLGADLLRLRRLALRAAAADLSHALDALASGELTDSAARLVETEREVTATGMTGLRVRALLRQMTSMLNQVADPTPNPASPCPRRTPTSRHPPIICARRRAAGAPRGCSRRCSRSARRRWRSISPSRHQRGDFVTPGEKSISIVDADLLWVDAYLEEPNVRFVHEGDRASIRLLGDDQLIRGHVGGVARGIAASKAQADSAGLATVNPIFTWVRLAQRAPVRIHIDSAPQGDRLASALTQTDGAL